MFIGSDNNTIKKAAETIKSGGIVAFPTETVYGLGADALNPEAVAEIFKAKGRPADNPLIVHIAELDDINKIAEVSPLALKLAEKFWPGPFTMILPKKDCIPDIVSAGLPTVAVRFPSHPIAQRLIRESGCPIAAPSANLSGSPSPTRVEHIINDYGGTEKIAGVIDGGECFCGLESTVISIATEPAVLLRPGYITPKQIMEIIPDLQISDAVKERLKDGEKALSPGMKHRHYAPKSPTEGIVGNSEKAAIYINAVCLADDKKYGVMCYDEEANLFSDKLTVIPYGKESNPTEQAAKIFDVLRTFDSLNTDKIFIRLTGGDGIELAVYNRLIRACDHNITNVSNNPLVFGVLGLSGAGKTTVCEYLKAEGFDHIDTDLISREIVPSAKKELINAFSDIIFGDDGELNRSKLAEIAFSSSENTQTLNAIMHKYIMTEVADRILTNFRNGVPSLIDGAALLEAKADLLCDRIIFVKASTNTRLNRVISRDGIDEKKAMQRFARQQPEKVLEEKSDFIFDNDSDANFHEETKRLKKYISDCRKDV